VTLISGAGNAHFGKLLQHVHGPRAEANPRRTGWFLVAERHNGCEHAHAESRLAQSIEPFLGMRRFFRYREWQVLPFTQNRAESPDQVECSSRVSAKDGFLMTDTASASSADATARPIMLFEGALPLFPLTVEHVMDFIHISQRCRGASCPGINDQIGGAGIEK